ncbi:MAG: fimbrillin family protein, partial [Bacteroidaceae bacterium]
TVGGEDLATNLWAEQPLFIYSFDKTDAELATPIITNEEAIAPKGAVSGPITWKKATTQYFYEGTTTYDFYGYHIDDAVATVGGVPAQDATTGAWGIDVKINGTQDLLLAKAELTKEQIAILNPGAPATDNTGRAYSAYSARKTIIPQMSFKHLLSRLTFSVYSGSQTATDNITIESIKVKSLATGKVVFAVKAGGTRELVQGTDPVEDFILNSRAGSVMSPLASTTLGIYDNMQADIFKQAETKVGESMMVMPATSYAMVVHMKQKISAPGVDPAVFKEFDYPATIQSPNLGGVIATKFDAGLTYNIKIGVRSLEEIKITAELTSWTPGGDVTVDPDAEVVPPVVP